jgi:uncharacterized protein YvpB
MITHKIPGISQHLHIKKECWQRKSCGIAGLAMILRHLGKNVSADQVLEKGLELNAYLENIGWKHRGLADIAGTYGFKAKNFDLAAETNEIAFKKFLDYLDGVPVLVSVHLDFDPQKGGHLITVTGFSKNTIFYNEPNSKTHREIRKSISLECFLSGWKRRFIVVYPPTNLP